MTNTRTALRRHSLVVDLVAEAPGLDLTRLYGISYCAQEAFYFHLPSIPPPQITDPPDMSPDRVVVRVTDRPTDMPFRLCIGKGVYISSWQASGISLYTEIPVEYYLLLCAMLGATQWRTLALNPILRIEDLLHDPGVRCLFSAAESRDEFVLHLGHPSICLGCREFYQCLGVEREILSLQQVIRFLHSRNHR